jgi:hypothetical protein
LFIEVDAQKNLYDAHIVIITGYLPPYKKEIFTKTREKIIFDPVNNDYYKNIFIFFLFSLCIFLLYSKSIFDIIVAVIFKNTFPFKNILN